jgi:hypothetical protein
MARRGESGDEIHDAVVATWSEICGGVTKWLQISECCGLSGESLDIGPAAVAPIPLSVYFAVRPQRCCEPEPGFVGTERGRQAGHHPRHISRGQTAKLNADLEAIDCADSMSVVSEIL